jgi:hypothetical protein
MRVRVKFLCKNLCKYLYGFNLSSVYSAELAVYLKLYLNAIQYNLRWKCAFCVHHMHRNFTNFFFEQLYLKFICQISEVSFKISSELNPNPCILIFGKVGTLFGDD